MYSLFNVDHEFYEKHQKPLFLILLGIIAIAVISHFLFPDSSEKMQVITGKVLNIEIDSKRTKIYYQFEFEQNVYNSEHIAMNDTIDVNFFRKKAESAQIKILVNSGFPRESSLILNR